MTAHPRALRTPHGITFLCMLFIFADILPDMVLCKKDGVLEESRPTKGIQRPRWWTILVRIASFFGCFRP